MNATDARNDVEVEIIADLPRGKLEPDGQPGEFVRVSVREFNGSAYLSLRVFWRARDGQYWSHKTKGLSVRLREAEDVAAALVEGLRLASNPGLDLRHSPLESGSPLPRVRFRATRSTSSPNIASDHLTGGLTMIGMERMMRTLHWTEGTWIVLADGSRWNFPPPEAVPGFTELATTLVHDFLTNMLPLFDTKAILGHIHKLAEGDPEGAIRTASRVLSIYRVIFAAGSKLLSHNYHTDENMLDALMPFNVDIDGSPEMMAKATRVGHEGSLMCNAIAAACGNELGEALARVARSN